MTLIELYDKSPLKNIVGSLSLRPDKLRFVGPSHPMFDDEGRVKAVLTSKGLTEDVEFHAVNTTDADHMRKILRELITDALAVGDDCMIETTGGDERLLLIANEMAREYKLQSQHLDIPTGTVTDTDGDGHRVPTTRASLTVKELLMLFGGEVKSCTSEPAADRELIDTLWTLTCHHPGKWNEHLLFLATMEKHHAQAASVSIPSHDVPVPDRKRYASIRKAFTARNIICNESTPTTIQYTYTRPYLRGLLEKAGNILEHKAFYEAVNTQYQGEALFDECCMGVKFDWEDNDDLPQNTNNEVDLILMRGLQPLFVSCKNGDVKKTDLYELSVIADQFGGEHVKKMLIATELSPDSDQARDALIRRAANMGIYLVPHAGRLTPEEWATVFLNAMEME